MTINICIDKQGDQWVAQCVEYDLAAQASSFDDVLYEFERTLNVQIAMDLHQGHEPLSTCKLGI
jgi:hypothetical protein